MLITKTPQLKIEIVEYIQKCKYVIEHVHESDANWMEIWYKIDNVQAVLMKI